MKLLCVILAWRLHAVTLSSEPTERAPPRATLTETVASVADGVIRSARPPLATAYVGAAARTDWNSTAGPLPQALSWAGSGRGPRVCASSRLQGDAELPVPESHPEPLGWAEAESLDWLSHTANMWCKEKLSKGLLG